MADRVARSRLPLVIKVGGSLAETGRLKEALESISRAARPVVVVAGGGAFADKVRDLQRATGFDDATAHRLAMLGMHQMAELFVTLAPQLRITDRVDGIAEVARAGEIPIWVPLPALQSDATIPMDWSITSDGIAARLAELLGGAPLVLLKSVDVAADRSAAELARYGVVDSVFPEIVTRAKLAWWICGPSDRAAFTELLASDSAMVSKS